jgi:hypothetical protein
VGFLKASVNSLCWPRKRAHSSQDFRKYTLTRADIENPKSMSGMPVSKTRSPKNSRGLTDFPGSISALGSFSFEGAFLTSERVRALYMLREARIKRSTWRVVVVVA